MRLKTFFSLPPDSKYRRHIINAICLCVFVFYGFRALQAEILRWDLLAALFLLGCGGLVLIGAVYWLILFFNGIRALFKPQTNGLLLLTVIIGALFAWYMPEPPTREEVKLFLNRDRYERVTEQGRSIFLAGKKDCIELSSKDKDLAYTCVFIEENYARFNIYRDVFSLVYSYDKRVPTAVDCDWNGYVWKQIDENWFVCKSDVN
jgi:hypothetical protein